jgi:hypothetical protein
MEESYTQPTNKIDRDNEVRAFREALNELRGESGGKRRNLIAIQGLGGYGKTFLLEVQFADICRKNKIPYVFITAKANKIASSFTELLNYIAEEFIETNNRLIDIRPFDSFRNLYSTYKQQQGHQKGEMRGETSENDIETAKDMQA